MQFLARLNAKYDKLPEPRRFFTAMAFLCIPYLGLHHFFGAGAGAAWFAACIVMRLMALQGERRQGERKQSE